MAGNPRYDTPLAARQPQPPQVPHPRDQYGQPPAAQAPHQQAPHPQAAQPQAGQRQAAQPQAGQPQAGQRQAGQRQAPPAPLGIDPEIWPAIRQSAARLARDDNMFIQQLHYEITKPIPDSAGAPVADIRVFCERMVRSLLWAVLTDQPLGVVADKLRGVGAQNWLDGFPDTLYGDVANALVQTVHYLSAYDWASSTGSAWISYYMWIKPHLLAGAQQAAERAAAQQAAEREAARVTSLSRDARGGHPRLAGEVNPESEANLLDDDDDENVGYGQIMVSMTRNRRPEPPRRPT